MLAKVYSAAVDGVDAYKSETEVNAPAIAIVEPISAFRLISRSGLVQPPDGGDFISPLRLGVHRLIPWRPAWPFVRQCLPSRQARRSGRCPGDCGSHFPDSLGAGGTWRILADGGQLDPFR
jgi:hypothetical protein